MSNNFEYQQWKKDLVRYYTAMYENHQPLALAEAHHKSLEEAAGSKMWLGIFPTTFVGYLFWSTDYWWWFFGFSIFIFTFFGALIHRMLEPREVKTAKLYFEKENKKWTVKSEEINTTAPPSTFTINSGNRTEEVEGINGRAIWFADSTWMPKEGRIGYLFGESARNGNPDPFPLKPSILEKHKHVYDDEEVPGGWAVDDGGDGE